MLNRMHFHSANALAAVATTTRSGCATTPSSEGADALIRCLVCLPLLPLLPSSLYSGLGNGVGNKSSPACDRSTFPSLFFRHVRGVLKHGPFPLFITQSPPHSCSRRSYLLLPPTEDSRSFFQPTGLSHSCPQPSNQGK